MARKIPIKIRLIPGFGIKVDPETFHVSANNRDFVEWSCDACGFEVDFGAFSPFATSKFGSPRAGSVPSGPAVAPASDKRPYKYTVTAGGYSVDPDGEVDP